MGYFSSEMWGTFHLLYTAGSWKAKLGEKLIWGDRSVGLVHEAEEYVKNLVNWIESILELTYGEKSTSF